MKLTYCPFCLSAAQGDICPHCGKDIFYAGDPMHLQVGYVLNGTHPYVLGASLGQGGFGITYIALDIMTNRRGAVKEYFPTYCAGRNGDVSVISYSGQEETFHKGKVRFLEEARMLKSLSDLHSVVNVVDFFEANNSAYLVMEFLDGSSLKDYIDIPANPIPILPKDKFLLMSDGVYNALSQEEICLAMRHPAQDAAEAIGSFISTKNFQDQDNYTLVILECC